MNYLSLPNAAKTSSPTGRTMNYMPFGYLFPLPNTAPLSPLPLFGVAPLDVAPHGARQLCFTRPRWRSTSFARRAHSTGRVYPPSNAAITSRSPAERTMNLFPLPNAAKTSSPAERTMNLYPPSPRSPRLRVQISPIRA